MQHFDGHYDGDVDDGAMTTLETTTTRMVSPPPPTTDSGKSHKQLKMSYDPSNKLKESSDD